MSAYLFNVRGRFDVTSSMRRQIRMKLRDKNGCVAYMKTSTNPNGFNKRKKSRQDSTGIASDTPKAPTTVLSWGLGRYGGLGRNELGVDPSPREIPMLSGCTSSSYGKRVIQVTSGWKTSIAVTADGSVFEWGWNSKFFRTLFRAVRHPELTQVLQKIGDFFRSNSNILFSNILREPTPQLLFGPSRIRAIQASAGGEHCAVLGVDGRVYTWGGGFVGQTGHSEDIKNNFRTDPARIESLKDIQIVQVACGFQHSMFLDAKGLVWACGKSEHGGLGIKTTQRRIHAPVCVQKWNMHKNNTVHEEMGKVKQISLGSNHSLMLDSRGRVWACGKNSLGQLGTGDFESRFVPTKISGGDISGEEVVQISTGQYHSIALTASGKVITWGGNRCGQLGTSTGAQKNEHANSFGDYLATPVPVEVELTGLCKGAVVSIHGGFHDTALIDEEGKVILFGGENDGSGMHRSLPRVFEAVGDIRATQVAFGLAHTLCLGFARITTTRNANRQP